MFQKVDFDLLKVISETPGAPGFENRIRRVVEDTVSPLVDQTRKDNLGNLVCLKKGKSSAKKIMVAAHLDEIAFIVTHVDDKGFIRFHTLGGFDPKTLTSQRVIVHGRKDLLGVMGTKPVHIMSDAERKAALKCSDFYIDVGLPADEVKKHVRVGDSITRQRDLVQLGECFNGKSLDNRIAVYILVEALKELKDEELPFDLYSVFTVQEEVGVRGAQVSTIDIAPDISLCLDITIAFDTPGSRPEESVTRLGAGTAIKVMDGMSICDTRMVTHLREVADKNKIEYQMEVLPAGGTDTAGMQRMTAGGSIAGALSIPSRNVHQTVESVHEKDVVETVKLLKASLLEMESLEMSWKD